MQNADSQRDLGPLAWVLDELRKSLEGATRALRRFVREAEQARGTDLESLDTSQLRSARQQLHQAVGALEMVGLPAPARIVRAMESLAHKFLNHPEQCSDEAAVRMDRASFALGEYLEGNLKGRAVSCVALFVPYRDVLQLVGEERIHPSDLWTPPRAPGAAVPLPAKALPLQWDADLRGRVDVGLLRVMQGAPEAALAMRDCALGLAAGSDQNAPTRTFWAIAAGFFEALGLKLGALDVYSKRTTSALLLQTRALARGETSVSDRLSQDLLFHCAQALPTAAQPAPALTAVREHFGLNAQAPVDYNESRFGRFDPALLVQARKRIATATETWSALSGGDTNRLRLAGEQFAQVAESLLKLHPECRELAQTLNAAIDSVVRSGEAPGPALGIEVATTVLYLEAVYEDMDPFDTRMGQRSAVLARRLQHVTQGGASESLEDWMEELYGRVSDRQTMGSVVGELRTNLGGVEKSLDTFFRHPTDASPMREVPSQLAQMRGVFSVLGLDQAALACVRLRDRVEQWLMHPPGEDFAAHAGFEQFGNSLGAMGFLIDMLSYQRALAKQLFVYDEEAGEFRSLLRREPSAGASTTVTHSGVAGETPAVAEIAAPKATAAGSAASVATGDKPALETEALDEDEQELRDIFLEEAREVIQNGLEATRDLARMAGDMAQQTTLRRAFHTLKGSARMVKLTEFGEAAWAMEQMLNAWLAEQKPVGDNLILTATRGLHGFGRWVQAITDGTSEGWSAQPFRLAADAQRLRGELLDLQLPGDVAQPPAVESVESIEGSLEPPLQEVETADDDFHATQIADFGNTLVTEFASTQLAGGAPEETHGAELPASLGLEEVDFSALVPAPTPVAEPHAAIEHEVVVIAEEAVPELQTEPLVVVPETVAAEPEPAPAPEPEPVVTAAAPEELPPLPEVEVPDIPEVAEDVAVVEPELESSRDTPEEAVKRIDDLEIPLPLYNVYLNEADEWSRRLATELSEWALDPHQPLPDAAVAWAHSLAGSSATVGFAALSGVARALEHALLHGQAHPVRHAAPLLLQAAEDMRWLLHQFAAGFLKEPEPTLVRRLQALLDSDVLDDPTTRPPLLGTSAFAPLASEPVVEERAMPETPASEPVDVEEAIEQEDVLDVDLFPIFEDEAQELMPQLGGALRQWSARVDNASARQEVLRVLHTLKGSARLAGARHLGEMAHRMESAVEALGATTPTPIQINQLLARYDALDQRFAQLREVPEQQRLHPEEAPAAAAFESAPVVPELVAAPVQPLALEPALIPAITPAIPVPRPLQAPTVRVRAPLLDALVNQAGEVLITRSRLEARLGQLRGSLTELSGNLDRLRHQLREMEVQSESQMQSRLAQAKDSAQGFDPLEFDRFTRVQELTRMMAESVHDVATVQRNLQRSVEGVEDDLIAQARQTRELQRELLRTRMVEFESIVERLHGVVRLAAKESGRQAQLVVQGGALEIDRGVLERVTPAFEHLLRNAVGHGIELPEQRLAGGKDETGTITISLHQQANDVAIEFSDDGAGLDLQRIREKAVEAGRLAPDQVVDESSAAQLIFAAGLSTATTVTTLAGRGIGLDVVRNEVNALGGRIETRTSVGKGTTFRLVLPLTTAVTQVVMLRLGESTLGVPANLVELVRRVPGPELEQGYQRGSIAYAGEDVPLFWGGALLQVSDASTEWRSRTLPVAVFRSAGQRVALHVDEVLGNQEVVVKNLGPQLSRLPGLTGMSVLASGAVVLIYNPVALVTVYGEATRRRLAELAAQPQAHKQVPTTPDVTASTPAAEQVPLILVVDDSITVRRVTQRLLKREGFRVALANDGLHALEQLQQEVPAVVLSDIEMPRMDGFDLARNIRADARLRSLPIIMITSRIAEKHREHARELGVNHYLGKPYAEDELIALVRQYTAAMPETASEQGTTA